jgi:GntR family histidine utilization transcriptional repressor
MTVNRALRELSDEQIVDRIQGSGTYVAQQNTSPPWWKSATPDEIAARGHCAHRSELHPRLERMKAGEACRRFACHRAQATHSPVVVHFGNE